MKKTDNFCGFPLYSANISTESYDIISNSVKKYISNYPENFKEAWNCPTKSTFHTPKEHNINCKILNSEIIRHTNLYVNRWQFEDNLKLSISNVWINISKPGSYQEIHDHISYGHNMLFSGVLYIETLFNSGDLVFLSPLSSLIKTLPPSYILGDQQRISPKNGLFVSFPSFLGHEVYLNKSNIPRISVSWNIEIINK